MYYVQRKHGLETACRSSFVSVRPCVLLPHDRTLQKSRPANNRRHRYQKKIKRASNKKLDDRVARKQVGGREQIEGKKSEVTEDE